MAAVNIWRGVGAADPADSVSREQWPDLIEARRDYCRSAIVDDCRLIVKFATDAESVGWLGYASRDAYLRDGLGLDPQMVEWAIEGLRSLGVSSPVTISLATATGRKLAAHGGDRRSERANQPDSSKVDKTEYGNSAAYTIARLERDRPDLADMVKSGELSANAAGVEAGFRKKPTPLDRLRSAWRSASEDERAEFLGEVGQ